MDKLAATRQALAMAGSFRKLGIAGLCGLFVGLTAFGLFYLANLGTLRGVDAQTVRTAYERGDLGRHDRSINNSRIGEHQFNDCLIVGLALERRAPREQLAVSPAHGFPTLHSGLCKDLEVLVTQGTAGRPVTFYHNYIYAQVTIARLALDRLGVAGLRTLYKSLNSVILALGLGLSF
jgi:hypothetical protein